MSKRTFYTQALMVLFGSIIFTNAAMAKTWFLPDYMEKIPNTYRNRTNDTSKQPIVASSECSKFKDTAGVPLLTESAIPSGQTCKPYPNAVINKRCVGNCKCDSKFIYNSSNCNGDFKMSGSTCNDGTARSIGCICDTVKYPHAINGTTCRFPDSSAGVCTDKTGGVNHYKMCYADTCWQFSHLTLVNSGAGSCLYGCPSNVDANCAKCNQATCYPDDCHKYSDQPVSSCAYGCKTTSSAVCTTKCKECWPDNCRNRADNESEYGCDKKWDDCPSKCQTGTTCTKRNCEAEGYNKSSCPANANCGTPCQPGCKDTTNYYKYGTCNTGYIDLENYWCGGAIKCFWR